MNDIKSVDAATCIYTLDICQLHCAPCRHGNCVPYRPQEDVNVCDQFYTAGVDFVYVPYKRTSGDFFKLYRAIADISSVILNTIEGCDGLEFLCCYLFPPCGNVSALSPPTVICEDVCHYMVGLCREQFEEAFQLVGVGGSIVRDLGLTLLNCSNPAEYVEPLPHCCSHFGIKLCTLQL